MNGDRLDILVVAGEPSWPAVNGGRVRTGEIALALAREFDVAIAAPPDPTDVDVWDLPLPWIQLPAREPPSLRSRLGRQPLLGCASVGRRGRAMLAEVIAKRNPRVVLYAISYLAAGAPRHGSAAVVVDFQNIEADRLAALARTGPFRKRLSAATESLKARAWEPAVARNACIAVAVSETDAARLTHWGADVVVVPNTADAVGDASPSKAGGPVVFVANFGYAPNTEAADAVIRDVWPRVRARVPDARLVIAGRESDGRLGWARCIPGVSVVGEVPAVLPLLVQAAVVLAPVNRGGGTQLKVAHALAARRVVVATQYSAESVPAALKAGCVVANNWERYADAVAEMLTNVERRHSLETGLRHAHMLSWDEVVAPLLDRLRSLLERDSTLLSGAVSVGAGP